MPDNNPNWLLEAANKQNTKKAPELVTDNSYLPSTNIVGQELDLYNIASNKYGKFNPLEYNTQELLGQEQGIADKWANALVKTAGKVGTSFVNTTVGLLSSLGSGAAGALDNNPNTTFLSGFWDDPVGGAMQQADNWFEKEFPNYQTKARQESPWYKDLGTADFWADGVLKNLGFAAGTFLGTVATMGLGDAALAKTGTSLGKFGKLAAASAADGIDYAKTGEGLAYLTGTAPRLASAGAKSSGLLRELTGSGIAAISESKLEASQTYKETYDDLISQGYSEPEADRIAKTAGNVDFIGNMALLMASNYAQFKGVFAKGNTINSALKRGAKSYLGNFEEGFIRSKPGFLNKALGYSKYGTGALREGFEEWGQYKINKLAKTYSERTNDKQSKGELADFLDALTTVASETFTNPEGKTWLGGEAAENFATGALLGAFGLPNVQKKDGRWKAEMTGGVFEARKNASEEQRIGEEAGKKLQELYTKYGKDNKIKDYVAGASYSKDINEAYARGDISTAKALEAQEIASDYITALELGKGKEFTDLLDVNASPEEVRGIFKNKQKDGTDINTLSDLSDETIAEQVGKNKQELKQYVKTIDSIWNTVKPLQNVIGQEATKDLAIKLSSLEEVQGRMSKVIAEVNPLLTDILYNWQEEIPEMEEIKEFFGDKLSAANMPKTLFNIANQKDAYGKIDKLTKVLQKAVDKNAILPDKAEKLLGAYSDLIDLSKYRTQVLDLYKAALKGPKAYVDYIQSTVATDKSALDNRITDSFLADINEYYDVDSLDNIQEPVYVNIPSRKEAYVLQTIDGKPTLISQSGKQIVVTPEFIASNQDIEVLPNEQLYNITTSYYDNLRQQEATTLVPDKDNTNPPWAAEGGTVDTDVYLSPEEVRKDNKAAKVPISINFHKTAGQESSEKGINQDPDQQRWYEFINNTPLDLLVNKYRLQVITPENNPYRLPFYQEAAQFKNNLSDNQAVNEDILSTLVVIVDKETGEPILDSNGLQVFTSLHEANWNKFSYPEFRDNKTKQELALTQAKNGYKAFQKVILDTYKKGKIPYVTITGRSKGILDTDVNTVSEQALGFTPNNTPLEVFTQKTEAETIIGAARIMAKPGNIYSHTTLGDPVVMFRNTLSTSHQEAAFELIKGIIGNTTETVKGLPYRQVLEELVYVGTNSKDPRYDLFFTKKGAVKIGNSFYNSVEELEQSKETILQDLSLKVYNVINKLLDSNISYEAVTIQDGKLTTISFPSYKDYLLGSNRPIFEIPLLAKAPKLGEGIKAFNRYLTFDYAIESKEVQPIQEVLESKVKNVPERGEQTIKDKKADIERRRQEELVSAVTTPISYEEFAKTKPKIVIVNDFEVYEYDKSLKKYVVRGAASSTNTSLESIEAREESAKDIEFFKDKSLKLDTVNFFWSERLTGRSPITKLTSYKKRTKQGRIDETIGDKLVGINAKYDAELAALQTPEVSNKLNLEYKALKNKVNPRAKSRGNQVILELSKQFDEKYPNFVDNLIETNKDFDRICS